MQVNVIKSDTSGASETQDRSFEIGKETTLDKVREQLTSAGYMTSKFGFMEQVVKHRHGRDTAQFNPIKGEDEPEYYLEDILRGDEKNSIIITVTDVGSIKRPDFTGWRTTKFVDRNMEMGIELNQWDGISKATTGPTVGKKIANPSPHEMNAGKFAPYMLKGCKGVIKKVPWENENVVICEKGSVINFAIGSWGAAGFGMSIESNKTKIISKGKPLYINYDNGNYGRYANATEDTYYPSGNTIVIDSLHDQSIVLGSHGDMIDYVQYRVRTWNVSSFRLGDKTYSSNLKPPMHRGDGGHEIIKFDKSSQSYIPGRDVQTAGTHEGEATEEVIGTVYDTKEQGKDTNPPIGEVTFYFLVFRDHAAAQRVIGELNTSTDYSD